MAYTEFKVLMLGQQIFVRNKIKVTLKMKENLYENSGLYNMSIS